ncbi:MAG: BON domain-containing protein [Natronospirillum sp.]|uniref:BON domain-containing protein n=1 Tax=Natronospirillum sp. TaxID=2812955 RepID=UPI0025F2984D|nr:BON domain-containing protein [Natronospirillum sp.]MCH8550400.1 BON domain-containing protein [Natronospirillum sp.]
MNRFNRRIVAGLLTLGLIIPAATASEASDDQIKGRVEAALMLSPVLSGRNITVEISEGMVTLSGVIGNSTERDLAQQVAASMPGVEGVEEDLELQQGNDASPDATQSAQLRESAFFDWQQAHIATKLRQEFADSPAIEGEDITFMLDGETLVLEGEVDTELERMVATQLSQRLDEVSVVDNRLNVREEAAAAEPVEMPGEED